jgi:hypothetical protein
MAASNIEQALHSHFTTSTSVHDEVADRIYWLEAPQKATFPYVSYFLVDDPHEPFAFKNSSSGNPRFQVNVYTKNDKYEALRIGNKVRDEVEKYSGTMDSVETIFIRCTGTRCEKMPDENDVYRGTFDANIVYIDP